MERVALADGLATGSEERLASGGGGHRYQGRHYVRVIVLAEDTRRHT